MYIPNLNLITDKTEAVEFMKRFSFATIIPQRITCQLIPTKPPIKSNGIDCLKTRNYENPEGLWHLILL